MPPKRPLLKSWIASFTGPAAAWRPRPQGVGAPVAPGTAGAWEVEAEGNDVKAVFKSPEGAVLGFALTGARAASPVEKTELTRLLPPLLA